MVEMTVATEGKRSSQLKGHLSLVFEKGPGRVGLRTLRAHPRNSEAVKLECLHRRRKLPEAL
jgi:hypothetical protein